MFNVRHPHEGHEGVFTFELRYWVGEIMIICVAKTPGNIGDFMIRL